jgi:hypothetical protein
MNADFSGQISAGLVHVVEIEGEVVGYVVSNGSSNARLNDRSGTSNWQSYALARLR